jgi:hypothetical protein
MTQLFQKAIRNSNLHGPACAELIFADRVLVEL